MDYLGGEYLYSVLSNDSDVTDIVGTSIHNARKIPKDDTSSETINFYQGGSYNAADEYYQLTWSVNCRSSTGYGAAELADKVRIALNRKSAITGDYMYFGTCSILPTIPPADESDVYNKPIEIILRRR